MRWGYLLNRWHDEQRRAHLLKDDASPACGSRYYTSTGPYPTEISRWNKCRRCLRIAAKPGKR